MKQGDYIRYGRIPDKEEGIGRYERFELIQPAKPESKHIGAFMHITDYIIDIRNSSLQDRTKLSQVLLDNGQELLKLGGTFTLLRPLNSVEVSYRFDKDIWCTSRKAPNISLTEFIVKFSNHSAEPEVKCICLLNGTYIAGCTSGHWSPHTSVCWKPCDFTVEPDIFDIDWWTARYEAGLPVWYCIKDISNEIAECVIKPSEYFSLSTGNSCKFYISNPSCQDTVEASSIIPELKRGDSVQHIHSGKVFIIDYFNDCHTYFKAEGYKAWLNAENYKLINQTQKEQPMDKTTLKLLLELLTGASEEVKDATNSKFVGIITKNDEYVGYIYCDSKSEATKVMQQPKMELHQLHLFEKAGVLAQKPREVTFDSVAVKTAKVVKLSKDK